MHSSHFLFFSFPAHSRQPARPQSAVRNDLYEKEDHKPKKKKKMLQKSKPAFQTSTGEQIHGAWDLDDDLL